MQKIQKGTYQCYLKARVQYLFQVIPGHLCTYISILVSLLITLSLTVFLIKLKCTGPVLQSVMCDTLH